MPLARRYTGHAPCPARTHRPATATPDTPRIRTGGRQPPANARADDDHPTMFNRKLKTTLQERQAELVARQAVIDAIARATARIEFAPDGTVLFANKLFLAIMKYRSEECSGSITACSATRPTRTRRTTSRTGSACAAASR
ncbi:hypothetical protein [Thauera phenylacetica]|nr:hypothetical protein [Thauera phenylacetica]